MSAGFRLAGLAGLLRLGIQKGDDPADEGFHSSTPVLPRPLTRSRKRRSFLPTAWKVGRGSFFPIAAQSYGQVRNFFSYVEKERKMHETGETLGYVANLRTLAVHGSSEEKRMGPAFFGAAEASMG